MNPEYEDLRGAPGVSVDVARPDADAEGFFLVKRDPDVDHETFFAWLLGEIGGQEHLLLHHADGLFVVWISFEKSRELEGYPSVAHVGGIGVDAEQLQALLGGVGDHHSPSHSG